MPQESLPEQIRMVFEQAQQEVAAARQPWYHLSRIARLLLSIYAVQLTLFALLAWWVHANPVVPLDVIITREFQENPAPWLRIFMVIISYPGSSLLHLVLLLLTVALFWILGFRLEAAVIVALSAVSAGLNVLLKILIARPRPTSSLVQVFQGATGMSFPSGHVMAYLAFWGSSSPWGSFFSPGNTGGASSCWWSRHSLWCWWVLLASIWGLTGQAMCSVPTS